MLFMAGVRLWKFAAVGALGAAALPVLWANLHDYQRQRVFTFLDPGGRSAGRRLPHHPVQDRAGLGRPVGQGLPARHPGPAQLPAREADRLRLHHAGRGAGLRRQRLGAGAVPGRDPAGPRRSPLRAPSQLPACWPSGVVLNLFIYVAINVSMVTGLIPVVGVPLPLISYGGTAMLTLVVEPGPAPVRRRPPPPRDPALPRRPLTGQVFTAGPDRSNRRSSDERESGMSGTARTGGRILVDQLRVQGVDTVFGVPGESYLEVLDALHDTPEIRFVICRQEGGAAMMAAASGELTGRPGVAMVTRGPGATNASAGVHIAQQDSVPMVLLIGQIDRGSREPRRLPGGRLSADVRRHGQMGGRDRRRRANPGIRPSRLRHRHSRPARAGGAGAARGHAGRHRRRPPTAGARSRSRPPPRPQRMAELGRLLAAAERPFVILGGGGWNAAGVAALGLASSTPTTCRPPAASAARTCSTTTIAATPAISASAPTPSSPRGSRPATW